MTGRAKKRDALTQKQFDKLRNPGRFRVSDGLYLLIDRNGNRRFSFRYSSPRNNRRVTETAVGGADVVTLAEARARADELRKLVRSGVDPNERKRLAKLAKSGDCAFGEAADTLIKLKSPGWSQKHLIQVTRHLKIIFAPLAKVPISEVTSETIAACARPKWHTSPVQARQALGSIKLVFDMAQGRGWRNDNPCNWRALQWSLGEQSHREKHLAAMPYLDIPDFVKTLRQFQATHLTAVALEFLILTGVRTNECLKMQWAEIDFDNRIWTIPGPRMKNGQAHYVPLSDRAIELLKRQMTVRKSNFVWRSPHKDAALAENALLQLVRTNMGRRDFTVHGFRSSLRNFLSARTDCPWDLAEQTLAHKLGDGAAQAYHHDQAVERRRAYMQQWARFIGGEEQLGNVVQLETMVAAK